MNNSFLCQRLILTAYLFGVTIQSTVARADRGVANDPIRLSLQVSDQLPQRSVLPETLELRIHNQTDRHIAVPRYYDGHFIRLSAKGIANDKATRWPLVLYPRQRVSRYEQTVVAPGKTVVISTWRLSDILGIQNQRWTNLNRRTTLSAKANISASTEPNTGGRNAARLFATAAPRSLERWKWDWQSASRPPLSPLQTPTGVSDTIEFRAEVNVEGRRLRSELITLDLSSRGCPKNDFRCE